ncbi:MAG: hypothetical protein A2939_03825 [Parcubacteria group bacterium RIFCSPLOWO2_01_FULL_48_18]|nr:MAG: hypothetical protein A3J67_02775 [Parcubacteria group bacterium RIFCSPHIGHO2_02_FULL_48_10b]OHB22405.1 MAG: hypothetical protein A2939_03825 [Parcubacteria group bacterium RIFCSPLOWO2_01_FULL_48_18]
MFGVILGSIIAAGIAGLIIRYTLDRNGSYLSITWTEYAIGMSVISLVLAPLTAKIGWGMAKNNNVTFREYWNGSETGVVWEKIPCSRDGPCYWEYDCDSYPCNPHPCNCDSEGKNCSTCWDTCYHDCPYCDEEWTFVVNTTLDPFTIAANRFPYHPDLRRWRKQKAVPQNIIDRAGVGVPDFWRDAKARIDSALPGPVTKRNNYENYILASDLTILKQYSSQIDRFVSRHLLPSPQSGIHNFYWADKISFVGFRPSNANTWQMSLNYLNAALGPELQGDLHLVIAKSEEIVRAPDEYILALKAHWQNRTVFGRDALSKNSIIVVLGTQDGERVLWGRATTGMPFGNDQMLVALQNDLKGVRLDPDSVIGSMRAELLPGAKIRTVHGTGVLEIVLWGLKNPATKFQRVSMTANNIDDFGGGFLYLKSEIQLTGGQRAAIVFVTFLVCMIVWVVFVRVGERTWRSSN